MIHTLLFYVPQPTTGKVAQSIPTNAPSGLIFIMAAVIALLVILILILIDRITFANNQIGSLQKRNEQLRSDLKRQYEQVLRLNGFISERTKEIDQKNKTIKAYRLLAIGKWHDKIFETFFNSKTDDGNSQN